MARTVNHRYRDALVRRAADHLLEKGQVVVSLQELAGATGVSSRMLVHHFGSREGLIVRALRDARSRQRSAFEARLAPQPDLPYIEVLADAWRWFATDEAQRYLRLFAQVYALAGAADSPYGAFLRESVLDWLPIIESGFVADGADETTARDLSTLTVAIVRGLLQDVGAVGDHERVDAAFARYSSLLQRARI